MRIWRGTGMVGAWLLATGLGAVVVWVGLQPVLNAAVPDRTPALSAADVRGLAPASAAPAPAPSLPVPRSTPPRTPSRTGSAAPPTRSARPAPKSSSVVVDGWTMTTQADGTPSYVRSFEVAGGAAVVGMVPGKVSLISATPHANYTVTTSQPQPERLVIQFVDSSKANIIDAIWWNGAPYAQVT
jgi:cytoskeletal protein RodZ